MSTDLQTLREALAEGRVLNTVMVPAEVAERMCELLQREQDQKTYRMRVYRDFAGKCRWRMTADNGKIVADSAESYSRPSGAVAAAERVKAAKLVFSQPTSKESNKWWTTR